MNDKNKIQEEVDKTLNSIDGIQRASANPFLFTRIQASLQMEEKSFWSRAFVFIGKPAVSLAAAVVIGITINAVIFYGSHSESVKNTQEEEQVFASEYNLSINTIYDATVDQQ